MLLQNSVRNRGLSNDTDAKRFQQNNQFKRLNKLICTYNHVMIIGCHNHTHTHTHTEVELNRVYLSVNIFSKIMKILSTPTLKYRNHTHTPIYIYTLHTSTPQYIDLKDFLLLLWNFQNTSTHMKR